MPIEFVTGDLMTLPLDAISHGCNTRGKMGSGVAKVVRKKFGERMYDDYKRRCAHLEFIIGDVLTWHGDDQVLYNLATQEDPGPCAKLWAVDVCVEKMLKYAARDGIETVGIPRIGAGIGGLKWEHVEGILIAKTEMRPDVTLVVVTLPEQ